MDVFSKAVRASVMSRIRGRGNKDTELVLMRLMRAQGLKGWRRQVVIKIRLAGSKARIAGAVFRVRPDFVFPKQRVAVFVDGCFWHGCRWHGTRPQGNAAFWARKLAGNKARDRKVGQVLRRHGWQVLRIWEHELRDARRVAQHLRFMISDL